MNPNSLANLRPPFEAGKPSGVPGRGPDKFPRRHVIRALMLGVLGDTGPMPIRDPITGRIVRRLGGDPALFPANFLGLQLARERILGILRRGKDEVVAKLLRDAHEILQESKGETPETPPPQRAVFVLEEPAPAVESAPDQEPGSSAVDHDGQEYVSP